jgi:hypothetical protein
MQVVLGIMLGAGTRSSFLARNINPQGKSQYFLEDVRSALA